ncbi:hypothetical protein QUB19_22620 [Microcoleus sp. B4-C5]|uniref:hypothetical protein n=1 Tax=unclassified Microcoleus TaxID=2642155 RepID=UPI002FD1F6AA
MEISVPIISLPFIPPLALGTVIAGDNRSEELKHKAVDGGWLADRSIAQKLVAPLKIDKKLE